MNELEKEQVTGAEEETVSVPIEKDQPEEDQLEAAPVETRVAKLVTNQGLQNDQYYVSEPWVDSELLGDEDEEEISGIEIVYDLRAEEVRPAMKAFQRKTIWRKNMIYTGVLGILAILYLLKVIQQPDYTMGKILGLFSACIIGFIWYLPAKHIKATAQAVELANDQFSIEISDIGFLIKEEGGKYLVRYDKPMTAVIELPAVYVVCVSKEKMFAIPKRCVPEEKREEVVALMRDGLKEKYKVAEK